MDSFSIVSEEQKLRLLDYFGGLQFNVLKFTNAIQISGSAGMSRWIRRKQVGTKIAQISSLASLSSILPILVTLRANSVSFDGIWLL